MEKQRDRKDFCAFIGHYIKKKNQNPSQQEQAYTRIERKKFAHHMAQHKDTTFSML